MSSSVKAFTAGQVVYVRHLPSDVEWQPATYVRELPSKPHEHSIHEVKLAHLNHTTSLTARRVRADRPK